MAVIVYDKFYEEKEGNVSPLSCIVTEELNGAYELAMEHPYDEFGKWKRLENDKIIEANTPDGMQPFRIYSVKPTMDRIFVNARHIFYDLIDNYVDSIDITHTPSSILHEIEKKMVSQTPFSFSSDPFNVTETQKFTVYGTLPAGLMYGDVNMDGVIDNADNALLTKYNGGYDVLTGTALTIADVDGDGVVDIWDQTALVRIIDQTSNKPNGYKGDYLGNWSVSDDWGTDFSKRFYIDIVMSEAAESKTAVIIANADITENEFKAVCGNGTIRVYAKNLPLNNLSVTFQLQEKNMQTFKAERKNPVELILDTSDGATSLVNIFGGELVRDGYNVILKEERGTDRGYCISYGKNLVGLSVTEDISSVVTVFNIIGKDISAYYQSGRINDYANAKYGVYENRDLTTSKEMRLAAEALYEAGADLPKVNIEVDFVLLQNTEEYKDYAGLAKVYLGDIVTVRNTKMNFNKKAKVIYYEYDALLGRYNKIELGDFLPNIYNTVTSSAASGMAAQSTAKSAETAVIELAETLSGVVTVKQDGLYISVDSNNIQNAKKVFHFGQSGLRYSSTGISGAWKTIIGTDGKIVQS